ncbi:AP2 domain-containing protein [Paraburkholderia youngii]|uniref:AP2 domain-containing protein n=1 Tax=Paraburkholderia youngii TaxID=2782701 RepID=UPI0015909AE7|nr:AP2 domain-containing protein [Paraburkholderia youngii]NUX58638.1 HNH endonuclease [Paraburkholderia youngii]
MKPLTQERLKELLHYDPRTGVFTNRIWRGGTARAGTPAGSINAQGYVQIYVDGGNYYGHRLAWLYVHGTWPYAVDHKRGYSKGDTRLRALRECTYPQNGGNRGMNSNNTSGFKGVSWDSARGKWKAQIGTRKTHQFLGRFDTPEEAHAAYCRAADAYYGDFSHHG